MPRTGLLGADAEPPAATATGPAGGLLGRLRSVPIPLVFAGSVAIALLLLWRQGTLGELGSVARRLEPPLVVGTLTLYTAGLLLLCARWHALVKLVGGTSRFALGAEVFLTSVAVNYAAPIGLAVPARAVFTTRDLGLPLGRSGLVVGGEALLDIATLGAVGVFWLAAGGPAAAAVLSAQARVVALAVLALGIVAGGVLALVWGRSPRWRQRIGRGTAEAASLPRQRPGWAVGAVGLTVVYWAIQGIVLAILLGALGVPAPSPATVAGFLGFPVLVGMLSPVPGGAGVREALMVAAAEVQRIDGAAVLLAALVYRAALVVAVPVLYGGVRLWRAAEVRMYQGQVKEGDR